MEIHVHKKLNSIKKLLRKEDTFAHITERITSIDSDVAILRGIVLYF